MVTMRLVLRKDGVGPAPLFPRQNASTDLAVAQRGLDQQQPELQLDELPDVAERVLVPIAGLVHVAVSVWTAARTFSP